MARKKKHPEHVNHERWLVSYADFITLLFAFFVVMFAVSQVDSKKVGRFTESFSKAIGVDMFPQPGRGLLGGLTDGMITEQDAPSKASSAPEELANLKATLTASAQHDQRLLGVQVITKRNELVLRLSDNLLFDTGTDSLQKNAIPVVSKLAAELKNRPVDIRVEGHTDNRPIHTARFRSNWDLSTGRAATIVAYLAKEGIAAPRLSAAGYGEFHPVATNATDEGRKQNRRVDLVITLQALPEPEPSASDAGAADDSGAPSEDAGTPSDESVTPSPASSSHHREEGVTPPSPHGEGDDSHAAKPAESAAPSEHDAHEHH